MNRASPAGWACFDGPALAPVLELAFGFDAVHARTGECLRDWVRDSFDGAHFDRTSKHWFAPVTPPDALGLLVAAGFEVLAPDDTEPDPHWVGGLRTPVLLPHPVHPSMAQLHPRMSGRSHTASLAGDESVWQQDTATWAIPSGQVSRVAGSPGVLDVRGNTYPGPHDDDPNGGPGGPSGVSAGQGGDTTTTSSAASPPESADDRLVFDGTLDGLRGVPVTDLVSVDPVTREGLAEVGIETIYDLLHTAPRRYIDRSNPVPVAGTPSGTEIAFIGEVVNIKKASHRGGVTVITVKDTAGTKVSCRWFNAGWVARRFHVGVKVVVFGTVETFNGRGGGTSYGMTNPLVDPVTSDDALATGGIGVAGGTGMIPVYPQSAKARLSTWQIRRATAEAVRRLGELADPVNNLALAGRGFIERTEAFSWLHCPDNPEQAKAGRDRLAYDELFRLQLSLRMAQAADNSPPAITHTPTGHLTGHLTSSLPWPLTGAQQRALGQIAEDMTSDRPMHRLIQGDVGSGKTVTALMAMLTCVEGGRTAALMAPTEILAAQHYAEIAERCEGLTTSEGTPLRVELVTNKVTGKRKKDALAGLASGDVDLVVGTHALLSKNVTIADLGLVVVDEQHRFGVEQRQELNRRAAEAGHTPDLLVMTATPVPRTAVLTSFGDLTVSVLDELPPGRTPIVTVATSDAHPAKTSSPVWSHVVSELDAGRQAFVVSPLVADSETKAAAGAQTLADNLAAGALSDRRIGVVHGKQKPDERAATMEQFAAGNLEVLVATTVIEVGVNVPNATVMVITGAENFGLAQLHQLRGRVGRGQHAGTCYLTFGSPGEELDSLTATAQQRLEAMVESTDGFVLAERDLHIRGPGTILGATQAGTAKDLRIADLLADTDLAAFAQEDASHLTVKDPSLLRRPVLRAEVLAACGQDAGEWLRSA